MDDYYPFGLTLAEERSLSPAIGGIGSCQLAGKGMKDWVVRRTGLNLPTTALALPWQAGIMGLMNKLI